MSVANSISAALIKFGRQITLRRATLHSDKSITNLDVTVYGHTQGYSPSPLVGGLTHGETNITISNKEIVAASWPGPPVKGDILRFDDRNCIIQSVEPKYLGTTVLVYELGVRG